MATVFVNPAQFGEGEDFSRYPRREEQDAAMLEQAGCDLLWMPSVSRRSIRKDSRPRSACRPDSQQWEGEARPGHFDGVTTIVARLLLAVRPDVALFGEKDFQQLAVIRRMVADLGITTEIAAVATVREPDGLALSSRNAYLFTGERLSRRLALRSGAGGGAKRDH